MNNGFLLVVSRCVEWWPLGQLSREAAAEMAVVSAAVVPAVDIEIVPALAAAAAPAAQRFALAVTEESILSVAAVVAAIANLVGIEAVTETAAETETATAVAVVTLDEHDKCWPV